MTRPKYTENPMAFLREVVAHGTEARLGKLQKAVDQARRALEDAEEELAYAVQQCEADARPSDLDLQTALCIWDSDAWQATLAGVDAYDKQTPDRAQLRPLYWSLMCHHLDREILDLNRLGLIFPDFNPKAGVTEGLARFKAGK
jgi:hypothetical protein